MKVLYIDINTNARRFARYFSFDPTLNQYRLKGKGGELFTISQWQFVAYIPRKNKKGR